MTKRFESMVWEPNGYHHPAKHASGQLGMHVHDDWGLTDHVGLEIQLENLRETLRATPNTKISELIEIPGNPLARFLENLYETITAQRPELLGIRNHTRMDLYHIVYGCISQFNFDDIRYFVEDKYARSLGWFTHEKELATLERHYGFNLYWALSDHTFVKVKEVLKNDFGFQ